MDPDKLKAAIEALKANDGDAALKILEDLLIGAPAAPLEEDPSLEALGETADPKPADEVALTAGLGALLVQLTGASTPAQAIEIFRGMRGQIESIHTDRATIELSERRGLIADLVKLGVEFPATAWEGKPEDRKPVKRLSDEPIAELRTRVALHKGTKGGVGHRVPEGTGVTVLTAPAGGKVVTLSDGRTVSISAAEIVACKKRNLTHEEFAASKANAVRRI